MAIHQCPPSLRIDPKSVLTAYSSSSLGKDVTLPSRCCNMNAHSGVPSGVRASSQDVDDHFGVVAPHYGDVPNDGMAYHGHDLFFLNGVNHGRATHLQHLTYDPCSAPTLVYGLLGPV